jgi:FkbM family methyltransferase
MKFKEYFERAYINFLSQIVRNLPDRGAYRLALKCYPLNSSFFSGINCVKKYLKTDYGLYINLDSKNLIDHKVLFTGAYERDTNTVLEKFIREGDLVIEAGSNTGSETLLVSRLVGRKGKVLAFEPVPHVFDKLKKNIELNNISNVELFDIALGNDNSEIPFNINSKSHPNQGMGTKLKLNFKDGKTILVNQNTVDSIWKQRNSQEKVSFIKMDIQGGELDMLKGARNVLEKFKPFIFLEANNRWSDLKSINEFLVSFNYTIYSIQDNIDRLIEIDSKNLISGNWLAINRTQS